MLKILAMLLIAIMATFTGCSSNGEEVSPSSHLEEKLEESDSDVMPEKLMQEYLSSYGVELESEGTCPKCKKDTMLTNMGLCVKCSYDDVYMTENDSEITDEPSVANNDSNSSSNSNNEKRLDDYGNIIYESNGYLTKFGKDGDASTKPFGIKEGKGKDSNGFTKVKEGNDGFYVHCNECGNNFFDNIYEECPKCNSNNISANIFNSIELGFCNSEYEDGEGKATSYDEWFPTLDNRCTGGSYNGEDRRFELQSFGGQLLAIRDLYNNGKIMGLLVMNEEYNSIEDSYCYKNHDNLLFFRNFVKFPSLRIAEEIPDNAFLKYIGYYND